MRQTRIVHRKERALPLIDVTLRPGFAFPELSMDETRLYIRKVFGPKLPGIFVMNCATFGMDEETPEDGIQVQFYDYGEDDINVPDIWIKVQFSEERPEASVRINIRDAIMSAIFEWFSLNGISGPRDYEVNIILDVFWGPTNGCGNVNGTYIEW